MLSDAQLTDRLSGLAASEFAAMLELDPNRSPLTLWLEKTGKAAPFAGNKRTAWGQRLEPLIIADYEERHGVEVQRPGTTLLTFGDFLAWATPDGVTVDHDGQLRTQEVKTHSIYAADYGPDGSDQVPTHEAIQCQVTMRVVGATRCHLVAFWDNQPHEFNLAHDAKMVDKMLDAGARWWRDHVVAHKAPTPDGSKATGAAIAGMFPGAYRKERRYVDTGAVADGERLVTLLRKLRESEALAKRLTAQTRQQLEMVIGDTDGLSWGPKADQRITWHRSADSTETDYKAAFVELRNAAALLLSAVGAPPGSAEEVLADAMRTAEANHTKTTPGGRRFCVPRSWRTDAPSGGDGEE